MLAKPFLKWAGGKGQLLERFSALFPKALSDGSIEHYYEPFLGGGAVFFCVMQKYPIQSALLFDANPELVFAYQVVQKDPQPLIKILGEMERSYLKLSEVKRKERYLKIRSDFNLQTGKNLSAKYSVGLVEKVAQLLFLNKTCFNGLFRVNREGIFNVPFGKYINPRILNAENLNAASHILSKAEIHHADFGQLNTAQFKIKKNAFVYFDPPYRPLSTTANFNSYSQNSFGDEEQKRLAKLFSSLDKKGIYQMLSNSDPKNIDPTDDFFEKIYTGSSIHFNRVPASRHINSDPNKRGKINEIVITNYKV